MTEQEICKINMNRLLIQTTVIRQERRTAILMSTPIQAGRISWQRLTAVIFHTMQTAIRFHTVTEWALNGRTEEFSRKSTLLTNPFKWAMIQTVWEHRSLLTEWKLIITTIAVITYLLLRRAMIRCSSITIILAK